MKQTLSVVTACYNDGQNLTSTLASLCGEMEPRDEVVVSDSSADSDSIRRLVGDVGLPCPYRYVWMPPTGVYEAQNRGILESTGEWIQVVNAGDRLCSGARNAIQVAIATSANVKMHVFSQLVIGPKGPVYEFVPTAKSAWPHQSVIVHRTVYAQLGMYPTAYRYCAEQLFFAKARQSQSWKLHGAVLTEYLLGGRSSTVCLSHLRDGYEIRRVLGDSVAKSLIYSFALPGIRRLLESVFGSQAVGRLKACLFRYYRPANGWQAAKGRKHATQNPDILV